MSCPCLDLNPGPYSLYRSHDIGYAGETNIILVYLFKYFCRYCSKQVVITMK
jgi:hypothetical protein